MEIGYVLPNGSTCYITTDLATNKYHYRLDGGDEKEIEFDKIYEMMESMELQHNEIPEFYQPQLRNIFVVAIEKNILNLFSNQEYMQILLELLTKQKPCSLRTLDWFLSQYSKKNDVVINGFDVYTEYEKSLTFYYINYFDAFARDGKEKYLFNYSGIKFYSNLAQLNLMYWVIKNGILPYIEQNLDAIQDDEIMVMKN